MANKTFARIPVHAWKMLLLSSVISGLAGSASAETFDIKGTVQKAVALTKVTDLNFGTVFTTSPDSAAAVAANVSTLLMSPAGVVTQTKGSAATSPPLIQMVAGTPGSYSSAALPAGSTVWIKLAHPDDPDTAIDPASATPDTCDYPKASDAMTARRITLSQNDFSGFFCVDKFTSDRVGLLDDGVKYSIGAATTLTFKIGASLLTQANTTIDPSFTYLEGAYTGTYIMEVNF